jgi:hypothetical protein
MPDIYEAKWRVGRKLGRTVYARTEPDGNPDCDLLLGMFDSPEVAAYVVALHNRDHVVRVVLPGLDRAQP